MVRTRPCRDGHDSPKLVTRGVHAMHIPSRAEHKEYIADQLNFSETIGPLIVNQSNELNRKTKLVDYKKGNNL